MCIIAIWSRRSEDGEGAQVEFRKILGEGDETTVAIIIHMYRNQTDSHESKYQNNSSLAEKSSNEHATRIEQVPGKEDRQRRDGLKLPTAAN